MIQETENKDDPAILRRKNIVLAAELKLMKKKNQNRKKEIKMLQGNIEDLKKEIFNPKGEVKRGYSLRKRKETYAKIYNKHSSLSLEEISEQSPSRLVQNTDEPPDEYNNLKLTSGKEIITRKKKE